MQGLDALLDPSGAGWSLRVATAIDDAGDIVGQGKNPSGASRAFLLTPVPEPSTIALLLGGAGGLLAYAWRRRAVGLGMIG